MSVIDIVLLALLLFGLIRGFSKGLFVEVASLVALIAGVYGAIHFSDYAGAFVENNVDWDEKYVNIVAFAITFIVIVIAIAIAGKALTKLADFAALGIINKVLGGVFGALKIGLILSVILIVFDTMNNTLPFADEEDLEDSVLYQPVKSLAPMIFPSILNKKNILDENPDKASELEIETT
ncbi:CvpA family protein [Aestuariibaculum sediminum]|uniref:CvpA family protein n=1 Tax=Aestuariibaculum sediminum TaxID=2770637 RepID=A0A8J6U6Y5_9FLAO|nr:CvpA family protein [Aestuariibaculum sediminum]MBD0831105.1 CvpA family protein [Aestuariibaculum sediminum]